jgi:hypothetical protein
MCDLHHHFILCTCEPGKATLHDPEVLTWTLSRHLGKQHFSMEGILAFPSTRIGHGFHSEWVESQLNERSCFDFDYKPSELDELRIYQGPDRSYEPKFLSLVFENGRWRREHGHGYADIRELIRRGKVEFAEQTRLNTLRSHLLQELAHVGRKYSPAWTYMQLVMQELEGYDPVALESEENLELLLEMMLQKAFERFGDLPRPEPGFLKEFDRGLQRAGKFPKMLPTVPFRRPLGLKQWYDIWERFQQKHGSHPGDFVFEERKIEEWKSAIALKQVKLYQLDRFNHLSSHHLSSHWIPEMLHGDDSFWTDEEFTWSICCDGNGYFHTKGAFG